MGLGRAVGYPDYSSAGTSAFIPEIWSTKLVEKFYDATVLSHISNTNYEGEIKNQGDKVWIRTRGTVPIHTGYKKGMVLDPPDMIESPYYQLLIDKGNYFYFGIDDVDKYQSDLSLMNQWAEDATENEKIVVDTDVLANIATSVDSHNTGNTAGRKWGGYTLGASGAPYQVSQQNILKLLAFADAVLTEQNIPFSDRFFVMPTVMSAMLQLSDIHDASMMGDGQSTLRSGRIGRLLNWTLYASNLLPNGSGTGGVDPTTGVLCFYCFFGHPLALTFASQFTETNYISNPERTFGKYLKSLHVYGYEVIKPTAIGTAYVQPTFI